MVQLYYMPWHALDVAQGDGHTQALATWGPGAAGQRLELPTSEQPGPQCVQAWHTPCPPGAQPSQQRAAGNPKGLEAKIPELRIWNPLSYLPVTP
ncbi:hypothetical protein CapIbe_005925 [Capra ibex]